MIAGRLTAGDTARDCLRNRLINGTVVHAATAAPFYGELYGGLDLAAVQTVQDLGRLPLVSRAQVEAAGPAALAVDRTTAAIQYTSGTTGSPLLLERSPNELGFIREFFGRVAESHPSALAPLMVALVDPNHGAATLVPGQVLALHSAVSDDEMLLHTVNLLSRQFHIPGAQPRVTIIGGNAVQVGALTYYVADRRQTDAFAIEQVHVTGKYISERWRAFVASVWNATVFDRYSLSEIFGSASRCNICDAFHFDPYVVAEVVDPVSGLPLESGVGTLALTSLNPFVQRQPMIRYLTNDLFRLERTGCHSPRYEFLGRREQSLADPDDSSTFLLPAVDLLETLDRLASINRDAPLRHITVIDGNDSLGDPVARVHVERSGCTYEVRVDVEVLFSPLMFTNEADHIASQVREQLLARSPHLRSGVGSGQLRLEIRPVAAGSVRGFGMPTHANSGAAEN